MRFLIFIIFLMFSLPAYAQTSPWEYIGKANATGYDITHTMVTRGADFGLALTWWEQTQELYLVFSYNNEDHNLPLEGSVEFLNEYIDYYYSDDVYEQKITAAIVRDFPTENQTLLMAAVNLEEVYALQDSVGLVVQFTTSETGPEKYNLSASYILRAYNAMNAAIEAETGKSIVAAYEERENAQTQAVKRARWVEVDAIVNNFQLPKPACGQFRRHSFYNSTVTSREIDSHNEAWFHCFEAEYMEARRQFKNFVMDLGGEVDTNEVGDITKYSAPSDLPQLQKPLKTIFDTIQEYGKYGLQARENYTDYMSDFNQQYREMQKNNRASIESQNRKNRNDQFWDSLSNSLTDSQQQIDDLNAYTSSLLSQQISTSPGYK